MVAQKGWNVVGAIENRITNIVIVISTQQSFETIKKF